MKQRILSVIGGGASGMAAAIEAAKTFASRAADVKIVLYERLPKVGRKILATGNGRCNIMNAEADFQKYNGDKTLLKHIFRSYSIESNFTFWKEMGLYLTQEEDGRLYPLSRQASSVLDALRFELSRLGIEVRCDTKIETIRRKNHSFLLNDAFPADAVIVACGGKASPVHGSDGSGYKLLSSLGILIHPLYPALTGIVFEQKNPSLKGVRAAGEILLIEDKNVISSSNGELQYTDYGVSGIPAMEVSREVSRHFALKKQGKILLSINSLPSFSQEEIFAYILNRQKANPHLLCEDLLSGVMPKKLGAAKLRSAAVKPSDPLSVLTKKQASVLAQTVHAERFAIKGVLGFDHAQVTAGGASSACFHPDTLEAKQIPGLFACGEILDVDGRCGGYNLSWAWSSGRCAGFHAADYIMEKAHAQNQ